jgi:hypothetical protein
LRPHGSLLSGNKKPHTLYSEFNRGVLGIQPEEEFSFLRTMIDNWERRMNLEKERDFLAKKIFELLGLHLLPFELRIIQLRVYPVQRQQLIMCAALDDFSLNQNNLVIS